MSKSTLERVAYGAIGAPVTTVRQMLKKLEEARQIVERAGDRLSDASQRELEAWAKEGEAIVDRIAGRVRSGVPEEVTTATTVVGDTMRTATTMLSEPTIALASIKGIGPASAEKLQKAGVLTTNALVERVGDTQTAQRLAETTGLSLDRLQSWAERADLTRVKGVGHEYRKLLQWTGVGTISELARARPAELAKQLSDKASELDVDMPVPSSDTVRSWIQSARGLLG